MIAFLIMAITTKDAINSQLFASLSIITYASASKISCNQNTNRHEKQ